MPSIHRFRAWYRHADREFLRREASWTLCWLKRPWFWLGVVGLWGSLRANVMVYNQSLLTWGYALNLSPGWIRVLLAYGSHLATQAISFAFMIHLLRRRALVWYEPERRDHTLASPLGLDQLFPAALLAPAFVMMALPLGADLLRGAISLVKDLLSGQWRAEQSVDQFRPLTWLIGWLTQNGMSALRRWTYSPLWNLVEGLALVSLVARFCLGRATPARLWLITILAYLALTVVPGLILYILQFGVLRPLIWLNYGQGVLISAMAAANLLLMAVYLWIFIRNLRYLRAGRAEARLRRSMDT